MWASRMVTSEDEMSGEAGAFRVPSRIISTNGGSVDCSWGSTGDGDKHGGPRTCNCGNTVGVAGTFAICNEPEIRRLFWSQGENTHHLSPAMDDVIQPQVHG